MAVWRDSVNSVVDFMNLQPSMESADPAGINSQSIMQGAEEGLQGPQQQKPLIVICLLKTVRLENLFKL